MKIKEGFKMRRLERLRTFFHVMGSSWDVPEEYQSADVMNRIQ